MLKTCYDLLLLLVAGCGVPKERLMSSGSIVSASSAMTVDQSWMAPPPTCLEASKCWTAFLSLSTEDGRRPQAQTLWHSMFPAITAEG